MKKHTDMKLVENKATVDLFNLLRKTEKKEVSFWSLRNILIKKYNDHYKIDAWTEKENIKYFDEMIGHAEKNLKRENFILVLGKAKKKIYTKNNFEIPEPFENIDNENISWDTNQKISNIYDFVSSNEHLIPFFQRGTAWVKSSDYIELAYSIFRSVPLGIMYLWKIKKSLVETIKHNKFKRDISKDQTISDFEKVNINELKTDEVYSVIDGQQRITGINVIINGTFDERKLFFNERHPDSKKFKFFKEGERILWTPMEKIYESLLKIKSKINSLSDSAKLDQIKQNLFTNLSRKLFISEESLKSFYSGFFESELVAICELPKVALPEILQVFVRTNQFGKRLNPTDIMMSYIVGQDADTRNKIVNLHKSAKKFKSNIKLSTILKLISVIFNNNATIQPSKFFINNSAQIKDKILDVKKPGSWNKIEKAFGQLVKITKQGDFDINWIKSENSIIPIIYWIIYKNDNRQIVDYEVINEINAYLLLTQLSRTFRSSTDQQLNFIIKNISKSEKFSDWKLNLEKDSTIKTIEKEISSYKYGVNNSEIKILLMSIGAYFEWSDSIEHIQARNNNGSDQLNNLSILPREINSELGDSTIQEKVKFLIERFNLKRKVVLEKLLLTEQEVKQNKVSSDRTKRILELFAKHLQ